MFENAKEMERHANPFDDPFASPQPIAYAPRFQAAVNRQYQQQYRQQIPQQHVILPKFDVDPSTVDVKTIAAFLLDEPKCELPEETVTPTTPRDENNSTESEKQMESPYEGTDLKEVPVRKVSAMSKPKRRGSRTFKINTGSAFDRIRKITFHDAEDDEEIEAFESVVYMQPLHASVIDLENSSKHLDVQPKSISLRNEMRVKRNGQKFGKCSQRFNIKGKKFKYTRKDNGEVFKMVGDVAKGWEIKNGTRIIARVSDRRTQDMKVVISAKDTDLEHIVALVTIMLLHRFSLQIAK